MSTLLHKRSPRLVDMDEAGEGEARYELRAASTDFLETDDDESDCRIKLNIGGTVFETRRYTLTRSPGSMLSAMFGSSRIMAKPDEFGMYFFDRDPTHFRLLLNFLRTGKVVLPESKWHLQEILLEAEFFGVDEVREGVQRALGGLKFEDNFSSLTTKETSWKACPIVTYCSVDNLSSSRKTSYEGMPQFCSIIDMDGRSAMRMTSVMSDMTRRAMCTVEKFDSDAQRVEVTFRVLPLEDESLPYLVGKKNCETVFELFLWNPNSLEYIGIYLHSDGGDTRSLNIACYESGHKKEKRVEGSWQYNTEMMFTIQAAGEKTEVKVTTVGTPSTRGGADAADAISNNTATKGKKKFHVPVSLSRIAPFHVVLGQRSGLPASVCYSDCAVRRVAVLI